MSEERHMSAPNSSERKKCWAARDGFWKCLDDNEENREKCQHVRKIFEENCSKTWLKYFDRRREYLKFKNRMENSGFELKDEKE